VVVGDAHRSGNRPEYLQPVAGRRRGRVLAAIGPNRGVWYSCAPQKFGV
jgi:hypothetical protein